MVLGELFLYMYSKEHIFLAGVLCLQGPPVGTSTNSLSASSKRKKNEKNKRSNQHPSIGELLVLPFLSKFPIPSDANTSQTRIQNE